MFLNLLIFGLLIIVQFYSYPFSSFEYQGTRLLNAFIIIICKLSLPVFCSWIILNYYGYKFDDIFKEIDLHLFFYKLFTTTDQLDNQTTKLKNNKKLNSELEMVTSINKQEITRLMTDKLIADNSISDKILLDKLIIEIQDKLIQDNLLKIKLNELIRSNFGFGQLNDEIKIQDKNQKLRISNIENSLTDVQSSSTSCLNNLLNIYLKLTNSIYLSHHFYLSYDLYSIRLALPTDLYNIIARLIYNLVYIHFFAIFFYLLIELPIHSLIELIYRKIHLNRINS